MNQNFHKHITLNEVSGLVNMAEVSFSRSFKAKSGVTLIGSLPELRSGHASRPLIDTTQPVAAEAYACGFNNISSFNRLFKKKKGAHPGSSRRTIPRQQNICLKTHAQRCDDMLIW